MHKYSQARSDLIYCRAQDLQPRVMFAVCLYNYPRSIRRIGQLEHLVDGNVIAEAFVAVTPVFVSDFPLFIRIVHARVEALQLLRVVYVKPEFHHMRGSIRAVLRSLQGAQPSRGHTSFCRIFLYALFLAMSARICAYIDRKVPSVSAPRPGSPHSRVDQDRRRDALSHRPSPPHPSLRTR